MQAFDPPVNERLGIFLTDAWIGDYFFLINTDVRMQLFDSPVNKPSQAEELLSIRTCIHIAAGLWNLLPSLVVVVVVVVVGVCC